MRPPVTFRPPAPRVVAVLACMAAAVPAAGESPRGHGEACEPRCTVRSGHYGYHQTQWRRWPTAEPAVAAVTDGTPAKPPRAVLPDADEESPRRADDPPPPSAVRPIDPAGPRLARLAADADAARLASAAVREAFTLRLVTVMLSEHDPLVRCDVLALAAGFDTAAAAAICAGALDDPDARVRLEAVRICVERGGPRCIDELARRAREDAVLGVRLRAVRSLGERGDRAAIPHLLALLDDADPAVQSRAAAALARTTGLDHGDVDRWRAWAANSGRQPARWSLGSTLRGLF